MSSADLLVIFAYFLILLLITLHVTKRGATTSDFFSGHHDLPWWALCLSLVATETSTLTFISVPGVGYTNGMVFVGLACGYLIGRIIVAVWFLPLYAQGHFVSVYQQLGQRFGCPVQQLASGVFLLTRLIGEGVRLATGMLPLVWMMTQSGLLLDQSTLLIGILAVTVVYTLTGGLRAVIWSDTLQLAIYGLGAFLCVYLFASHPVNFGWLQAQMSGKFSLFQSGHATFFNGAFTPSAALVGGTILSLASHGTDQLMVQRVLAARTLGAARMALIGSAIVVGVLFFLLSLVGIELWMRNQGASLATFGLHTPDELFPYAIVFDLPAGLRGLLIAGVLSATMGSLSATLNAMATASMTDFSVFRTAVVKMLAYLGVTGRSDVFVARTITVFWGVAIFLATLFMAGSAQSAVIVGLSIAGWSWGPVLGAFLYGMVFKQAQGRDVAKGLVGALVLMAFVLVGAPRLGVHIAFPWLVPLGLILLFLLAGLSRFVLGVHLPPHQNHLEEHTCHDTTR